MRTPHDIVKRPVITEKANIQQERHNQYSFEVDRQANKHEIKQAIETLFGVTVISLRVLNIRGKKRRMGMRYRREGRTAAWKKAVVTLPPDQNIDMIGEGA